MRGRDLDPAELAALLGDRHPPTPEQAAVVASPLQPLLVVAGAGSGKTSTMAARVVWLVVTGRARPEQVLGLTFTRKAAGELAEKVRGRLAAAARAGLLAHLEPEEVALPAAPAPPGLDAPVVLPGEPVVSTYHAYAGRLYREHAVRLGLEPGARLITPAVAFQLMSSVVAARDEPLDAVGLTPPSVVAGALALAGELAEHLAEPRAVRDAGRLLREQADGLGLPTLPAPTRKALACQAAREQLLELVEAYERAKRTRDLVDHGDVVALAARAARASAAVGEVERARAGVVLLDEYQDTGHAQRVLLTTLFGRGHPVTAVGDPSQSIYGWRGASAGGLARFPRDFPLRDGSPAPRLTLATSHRNDGAVLRAANHLARPLAEVTPDVPVLRPAAGREADGRVTAALLETEAEEAAWVAEQVWQALGGAVARSDSAAVLVRRRAQVPALREALVGRGLPVEVVGLGGLLTVPEVADVVAVLRAVADPGANPSVVRLLTGPRCRLGPRDLAALGRRARDLARSRGGGEVGPAPHAAPDAVERAVLAAEDPDGTGSLVEAVADPGPAGPDGLSPVGLARVQELAAVLARVREQAARPLPDLVALVERLWGVDLEVAARPGTRDAGAARVELDAFADVAAEFAGDAERPTLDAFVAYLEAAEDEERGLETGGGRVSPDASVKVLTVHAAKGLEWDVVAVPGLATGSLAAAAVFPASPRVSPAWTRNRALLPFALRGDAEDLPVLAACDGAGLQGLEEAVRARALLEERRLAYVALTRARHVALVSGRWWGEGKSRLGPSLFLREMVRSGPPAGPGGPAGEAAEAAGAAAGARAAADVDVWCPEPDEGAENPTLGPGPLRALARAARRRRAPAGRGRPALGGAPRAGGGGGAGARSRRARRRGGGAAVGAPGRPPRGADRPPGRRPARALGRGGRGAAGRAGGAAAAGAGAGGGAAAGHADGVGPRGAGAGPGRPGPAPAAAAAPAARGGGTAGDGVPRVAGGRVGAAGPAGARGRPGRGRRGPQAGRHGGRGRIAGGVPAHAVVGPCPPRRRGGAGDAPGGSPAPRARGRGLRRPRRRLDRRGLEDGPPRPRPRRCAWPRSSWRPTAWRGPSSRTSPWSRCGRPSTTWPRTSRSRPSTSWTAPVWRRWSRPRRRTPPDRRDRGARQAGDGSARRSVQRSRSASFCATTAPPTLPVTGRGRPAEMTAGTHSASVTARPRTVRRSTPESASSPGRERKTKLPRP